MKILKALAVIVVVAVVIVIWAAPIGPLPGIFIGGSHASVPASWGDTRSIHEIKLEVGEGIIRRVVIIWVVQVDGDLYVVGSRESGWTNAVGSGGPARLRMNDKTYDMQATAVIEGIEPILEAYLDKYRADYPEIIGEFPPMEEAKETVAIFHLTAA